MGKLENTADSLSPRDQFLIGEHLTNGLRRIQEATHQKLLGGKTTDIEQTARLVTTAITLKSAINREEGSLFDIADQIPVEDRQMQQYLSIWTKLHNANGQIPTAVVHATENLARNQLGLSQPEIEKTDDSNSEFPEIVSEKDAPYTLVVDRKKRTALLNGHEKRFAINAKLVLALLDVFASHPRRVVPKEILDNAVRSAGLEPYDSATSYRMQLEQAFSSQMYESTKKSKKERPRIVGHSKLHRGYYLNANSSFVGEEEAPQTKNNIFPSEDPSETQVLPHAGIILPIADEQTASVSGPANEQPLVVVEKETPSEEHELFAHDLTPEEIFLRLLEKHHPQAIDLKNAAYDVTIFMNSSKVALNGRRIDNSGFIHTPNGRLFLLHAAFAGQGIPEKDIQKLMIPMQRQMGIDSVYMSIQHSFHAEIRHTTGQHYNHAEPILDRDHSGKYFMNARVTVVDEQNNPYPPEQTREKIATIIRSKVETQSAATPLPQKRVIFTGSEEMPPSPENKRPKLPQLSNGEILSFVNTLFDVVRADEKKTGKEKYDVQAPNELTVLAGGLQIAIQNEQEAKNRRDQEFSLVSIPRRNKNENGKKGETAQEAKAKVLRELEKVINMPEGSLEITDETPASLIEALRIAREMNGKMKGNLISAFLSIPHLD